MHNSSHKNALVLTGGGARAAYQVSALRAISTMTKFKKNPFPIISGFSAGAINASWLASHHLDFNHATEKMWDCWANLKTEQVYKTSSISLGGIAYRWIQDRILGGIKILGLKNKKQITYLLDTKPLREFIQAQINFETLNENIKSGEIYGFAITAANYHTGHSVVFFDGNAEIKEWKKLNRLSKRTRLHREHVMASSAIPIFFPPVKIDKYYFGDGMIRLNAPLSSAIHMGAEKMLVIGIRGPSSENQSSHEHQQTVSIGEIAGTILNGLFFDSLDADLERMERVNRGVGILTPSELRRQPDRLREIPLLYLRPSQEVTDVPECELSRMPANLRFVLRGIGVSDRHGGDILSYLAFEPKYIKSLLQLGYDDTLKREKEIIEFFKT
jgi:NTE family protein